MNLRRFEGALARRCRARHRAQRGKVVCSNVVWHDGVEIVAWADKTGIQWSEYEAVAVVSDAKYIRFGRARCVG